jgi:hypothetical protein
MTSVFIVRPFGKNSVTIKDEVGKKRMIELIEPDIKNLVHRAPRTLESFRAMPVSS